MTVVAFVYWCHNETHIKGHQKSEAVEIQGFLGQSWDLVFVCKTHQGSIIG